MREQMLKIADRLEQRVSAIYDNLWRDYWHDIAERDKAGKTYEVPMPRSPTANALSIFAEEIRETLEQVKFREYDDIGDLFTIDEFAGMCGMSIIDSDGHGYYAKEHPGGKNHKMLVSSLHAVPSRLAGGDVNGAFTHVAWYNK